MIKIILISLVTVVVLIFIVASFQPADYRVVRTTTISAPAAVPFSQVNDLHKWQEISPYKKLDLTAKYTFDGPPAGPGASLAWVGNSQVGEGKMTITESRPNELIRMKLDFVKPFASTCFAEFTFKPEANQTSVSWAMTGSKNMVSKVVCLFMNMDKMVGAQFEEGLANLKTAAETVAAK